jgi:hypothetical protein
VVTSERSAAATGLPEQRAQRTDQGVDATVDQPDIRGSRGSIEPHRKIPIRRERALSSHARAGGPVRKGSAERAPTGAPGRSAAPAVRQVYYSRLSSTRSTLGRHRRLGTWAGRRHVLRDRPHKPDQFARDRSNCLGGIVGASDQRRVSTMQPLLSLPTDGDDGR